MTTEREAAEQRLNADWNNYSDPANKPKMHFDSWLVERAVALSVENARLKEALQEVRSDIARAHTNNVIWPNTIRMLEEIACQK